MNLSQHLPQTQVTGQPQEFLPEILQIALSISYLEIVIAHSHLNIALFAALTVRLMATLGYWTATKCVVLVSFYLLTKKWNFITKACTNNEKHLSFLLVYQKFELLDSAESQKGEQAASSSSSGLAVGESKDPWDENIKIILSILYIKLSKLYSYF